MLTTSSVFEKIIALLEESRVNYQLTEHEPVFTSEEAAKVRGVPLEWGAKAIVFAADKKPILIVIPADRKIDLKSFKKSYSIKDLRMLTPEEVKAVAGVEVGAVPPLGNVMGLLTYFDEELTKKEKIAFNPGAHTKSIVMSPKDLIHLCSATIGNFSV